MPSQPDNPEILDARDVSGPTPAGVETGQGQGDTQT